MHQNYRDWTKELKNAIKTGILGTLQPAAELTLKIDRNDPFSCLFYGQFIVLPKNC